VPIPPRAATIGVIYGYDVGASAGAMLFLPKDLHLSTNEASSVNTVLAFGLLIGALLGGRLIDLVGRRGGLMVVASGFTLRHRSRNPDQADRSSGNYLVQAAHPERDGI
jgi:MFS family permease